MASDGENSTKADDVLVEFILKYKEMECLWKTNHRDYTNKHRRLQCLRELLAIMKKTDPDADIYKVKRKINSIRCNFNKQHRKVMEKTRDSMDEDEASIYVDSIRNYKLLSFLIERNPQKEEEKNNDKETIYLEDFSNEESYEEYTMKDEPQFYASGTSTPTSVINEQIIVPPTTFPRKKGSITKKRRLTESKRESNMSEEDEIMTAEASSTSYKPQYSSYGDHIAEKLRCMPKRMAIYCQKIINDAIFHAEIGDLNKTSRIVTDY